MVVGSGGREHALAWSLSRSASVDELHAAPGNPGIAALARINIYEKMFHPMSTLAFDAVSDSKLDGRETAITVAVGGESRAYPIRSMSYHHVVNDLVGGVPIVATY